MPIKKFKPTKRQVALFEEYVKSTLSDFGMGDWRVDITYKMEPPKHNREEQDKEPMGTLAYSAIDRIATVNLNTSWEEKPTDEDIKYAGVHEILHLLICRLSYLVEARTYSEDAVIEEEHAIIQRITNFMLKYKLL